MYPHLHLDLSYTEGLFPADAVLEKLMSCTIYGQAFYYMALLLVVNLHCMLIVVVLAMRTLLIWPVCYRVLSAATLRSDFLYIE